MGQVLRSVVLFLAALSVLAVAAPAQAATVDECQATIGELRDVASRATFTGQNAGKVQAGLVGKLDTATAKLEQGKTADALQALTQFRDKVTTLNAQGKLAPSDAELLLIGTNDAIACVESLPA